MLEYPELFTIINQMKKELVGKTIASGAVVKRCGNMFMSEAEDSKYTLLAGGKIIAIEFSAPEIFIALDNSYGIMICQSGGKIIYQKDANVPVNCNIRFDFTDSSSLVYSMNLFTLGIYAVSQDDWNKRKKCNAAGKFQPLDENTFEEYLSFIELHKNKEKEPVKTFLSTSVAGVMSTFAAEILLYAKIYPSTQLKNLCIDEHKRIYLSMKKVLSSACEKGGRTSEYDLYMNKGGYTAMAERKNIGKPCPVCGNTLLKNSCGGVTAFCAACQRKK